MGRAWATTCWRSSWPMRWWPRACRSARRTRRWASCGRRRAAACAPPSCPTPSGWRCRRTSPSRARGALGRVGALARHAHALAAPARAAERLGLEAEARGIRRRRGRRGRRARHARIGRRARRPRHRGHPATTRAASSDVPGIAAVMADYVLQGTLLPRPGERAVPVRARVPRRRAPTARSSRARRCACCGATSARCARWPCAPTATASGLGAALVERGGRGSPRPGAAAAHRADA